MAEHRILDNDVICLSGVPIDQPQAEERPLATLAWGDTLKITGQKNGRFQFELPRREFDPASGHYQTRRYTGLLPEYARFRQTPLLKVRFVDVGQGDATIIETPEGKIILIDGGEDEHLRRYINVAYSHVLQSQPLTCEAIVVTHGDADHYAGLTKLAEACRTGQSPLIQAKRVFHNGLVKGQGGGQAQKLGKSVRVNGTTYAVELWDDLLRVPPSALNEGSASWQKALAKLKQASSAMLVQRLEYGQSDAFGFLAKEGIQVQVLGPICEPVNGKPALPFFSKPGTSSPDAGETINGHSVVLRLAYGNVRFLLGADLNAPAEERLVQRARQDGISLVAEVLKVPHHGSSDFTPQMLAAVRPVVSVISCGDENTARDYIHPRAGLVGALGKYSRAEVDKPLVYATEMIAFFKRLGDIQSRTSSSGTTAVTPIIHNAYQKTAFGIVHVRTDGHRVLVTTNSAKDDQKETYAFTVDEHGQVEFGSTNKV